MRRNIPVIELTHNARYANEPRVLSGRNSPMMGAVRIAANNNGCMAARDPIPQVILMRPRLQSGMPIARLEQPGTHKSCEKTRDKTCHTK